MKERLVNDRYRVIVPDHIADWDAPSEWERQRFLSMEKHLKKGDILYDIGAEQGWQSAIYAQFVGGENMVLVEPSEVFWPNIKQTWEANKLPSPLATCCGLAGSREEQDAPLYLGGAWPSTSDGKITETMSYVSLDDQDALQLQIDGIPYEPDAITIDVEGAELEVLRGAEQTLRKHKPKVWVSVHDDLMLKDYGETKSYLWHYLTDLGYKIEDLGWDGHETHWYCS